ncbi:hypothetical protein [Escherichia coli]|uniref:hypothetical protein n=1 Tax=Escherichia coli TaxID=562 RepID=UPI00388FDD57
MENIHKYVEDPAQKKLLREGDGIGTSATRATIVAELKETWLYRKQRQRHYQYQAGKGVIAILPELVKSPS